VAGSGCGENLKLFNVSIKTGAVAQGDVPTLRKMLRIDAESVYSDIKELI
jgi:hypothetical protein